MNILLAVLIHFTSTWAQLNASDGRNGWDCYIESYPGRIDAFVCERDCYGTACDTRLEFDGRNTTRLRVVVSK